MIGRPQEIISWLFQQDRDKLFVVKERKRHRSLTQNAYYWVLLNELARAIGLSDSDVHKQMLRDYGVCDTWSARIDVPPDEYFRYWDEIGRGWLNGVEYRHIRAYKGSSEMDSTEFSHLLDGLIQECEQQDIPVMPPWERAQLEFVEGSR